MKVKCGNCGKEEVGRIHNLRKEWAIFFTPHDQIRAERCSKCKPLLWDRKDNFEIFKTEMNDEIWEKIKKLKIINSL